MLKHTFHMLAAASVLALTAPAAQSDILDGVVSLQVLPGWRAADGGHIAGLQIMLAPGWKTYWRAPGDAGIPPQFNWAGSENIHSARLHWPVPEVSWKNGLRSIGYKDTVVIPMMFTPKNAGAAMMLNGEVLIGVCDDICIPVALTLSAQLPAVGHHDAAISAALADRPMTADQANVGKVTCTVRPIEDGLELTAQITMPPMTRDEHAAIETADPSVWVAEPEITRNGALLTAVTDLVPSDGTPFALDRSGVRITVFGGGQAVDIRGCTGR